MLRRATARVTVREDRDNMLNIMLLLLRKIAVSVYIVAAAAAVGHRRIPLCCTGTVPYRYRYRTEANLEGVASIFYNVHLLHR
jgi:hypothetical protein